MPSCDGSNCGACSNCEASGAEKRSQRLEKELLVVRRKLDAYISENKKLRDIIIKKELNDVKLVRKRLVRKKPRRK